MLLFPAILLLAKVNTLVRLFGEKLQKEKKDQAVH